jgi:hypothetical protein
MIVSSGETSGPATRAQSVQRIATDWTVRGLNPGVLRVSTPVRTGRAAHRVSFTMSTSFLPGVKRPGRGVGPQRRG